MTRCKSTAHAQYRQDNTHGNSTVEGKKSYSSLGGGNQTLWAVVILMPEEKTLLIEGGEKRV